MPFDDAAHDVAIDVAVLGMLGLLAKDDRERQGRPQPRSLFRARKRGAR
jgi:hypothetical protein